jgi:hypothetical protein
MSVRKFKFISPSVAVREIDNSQNPRTTTAIGPVVIGRTRRGPALRPVRVESFSDFVEVFGDPIAGAQGGDIWRDGNLTTPTYAAYAAQAWLRNSAPINVVRLLGAEHEDKTSAGEAGWETKDNTGAATALGTTDADGGAYGLFIMDRDQPATGALAAIWYLNQGSIALTGTLRGSATTISGTAVFVESVGQYKEFKAEIRDSSGAITETTTFNFNSNSKKYIRKVFNTNPILTNADVSLGENTASYWLGQTFERHLDTYATSSQQYGVILGLAGTEAAQGGSDYRMGFKPPQTGWFFKQDTQGVSGSNSFDPTAMTKLFKFVGLDADEWIQSNLKVSIQDIKASTNPSDPYGVFTVVIRKSEDSDNAVSIVERFSSCNLNPFSPNYIAKKIGDRYVEWDDNERLYREFGNYPNQSKFVRVVMNQDVDAGGINAESLPFGVYGPVKHKGFTIFDGSGAVHAYGATVSGSGNVFAGAFAQGGSSIARSAATGGQFVNTGTGALTASFLFPEIRTRLSSSEGNLANPKEAYFGMDNSINSTSVRFDPGYSDMVRSLPAGYDSFAPSDLTEYSWVFTLDDVVASGVNAFHQSGSRAAGTSITALSENNYRAVLDAGYDRFTAPMFGGFDGLDITEKEPFNNADLEGGTELTNYAWNSIKRAIDSVSDPEVVECNLMVAPGLTNEPLTDHLLKVCEDRADALGIIDLKGGFVPSTENNLGDDAAANRGDVDTTIDNLRQRGLNTSYGCCYYPWVQIRDSINGATLWAPPSIVGLGTMAFSERSSELWFAPAGFNRGGLTEGSAGIPVVGVRERLTSKQRDKLYEANINPIATFPSEGIVVFGQKTLQVTPSALDRINVRRLLIFLKKEVSRFAATILFDQNVKSTWNRFLGKVEPFLESVKTRLGLTEYKVKLDEETTTDELVDRNILYAKIFLKPARSIEFIALDFVITSAGASFED